MSFRTSEKHPTLIPTATADPQQPAMNRIPTRTTTALRIAIAVVTAGVALSGFASRPPLPATAGVSTTIPAWTPSHGRTQPIVVIAGENGGTELVDFAIPYGVLKRAGIETVALSAHDGPLRFRPALKATLDATMAEFDTQHPEGADYVIVPAMVNSKDPTVLAWIADQARKGATVVSICDGALVVGHAGLLKGKWATAHWASEGLRRKQFPATHWVRNTRYVVDGKIVSSAGISAALPTSLALVEAIEGKERASVLAREMGVVDWSVRHNSDAFRPHFGNLGAFVVTLAVNPYLRSTQIVGVPLNDDMDEINLAVVADAYSRTGRSRVVSLASTIAPVTSRHGLRFLPDVVGDTKAVDVFLPPLANTAPGKVFDTTLASLSARYGRRTAYGVALDFEYPGYTP